MAPATPGKATAAPDWTDEVGLEADLARQDLIDAGFYIDEPDDDAICAASVEPQKVRWLWPGRLPLAKVSILDGDPGLGKSTFTIDLAARITRGQTMPDGGAGLDRPGNVLIISAEDGAADTIRPRLEAAGANLDRVWLLDHIHDYDEKNDTYFNRGVELPRDLLRIQRIMVDHQIDLVVLDPVVAFLDGKTDAHRDQDVRRVLYPLAQVADVTGAALLCLRHLNKAPGTNPIYRGGGSIGFIGAARLGLLIACHPEDEGRRVLAVAKSNLAPIPESLVFRLCNDDLREVAFVCWDAGTSPLRAGDLLRGAQPGRPAAAREAAEEFLEDLLSDGPVEATVVTAEATAAGINGSTLKRAKGQLGVTSCRAGGLAGDGTWYWALGDIDVRDEVGNAETDPNPKPAPPTESAENGDGPLRRPEGQKSLGVLTPPVDPNNIDLLVPLGGNAENGPSDQHLEVSPNTPITPKGSGPLSDPSGPLSEEDHNDAPKRTTTSPKETTSPMVFLDATERCGICVAGEVYIHRHDDGMPLCRACLDAITEQENERDE